MGPDEYHTAYPGTDPATAGGLNNNTYTNVTVAWVLSAPATSSRCCPRRIAASSASASA